MKRRRIITIAIFATIILVGGFVAFVTRAPKEPVYSGKPLGVLLDEAALSHSLTNRLGPEAVPFILNRLAHNDSPWRNKYREFWSQLSPGKQKLLPTPKPITFSTMDAWDYLSMCGPNAIPVLRKELYTSNPAIRETIVIVLSMHLGHSLSDAERIEIFMPLLSDNDAIVRAFAASGISLAGSAASNAVPILIANLGRNDSTSWHLNGVGTVDHFFSQQLTASALGRIGPAAISALPALSNLMATGDSFTRLQAAIATWHISSNEDIALPILIEQIPKTQSFLRAMALNILAEMGPRAKAAVPVVLEALKDHTDQNVVTAAYHALERIDPEAAAKAGEK